MMCIGEQILGVPSHAKWRWMKRAAANSSGRCRDLAPFSLPIFLTISGFVRKKQARFRRALARIVTGGSMRMDRIRVTVADWVIELAPARLGHGEGRGR